MSGIKLDQLIPKKVELEMTIPSGENAFVHIGPFTLEHEIWLKETFGDKVQQVFKDMEIDSLARIAFRVMDPADRMHFPKQTVETIDEEGNAVTESIGGYRLFARCFSGTTQKIKLLEALTESLGVSRALIEEIEAHEQKKTLEAQSL